MICLKKHISLFLLPLLLLPMACNDSFLEEEAFDFVAIDAYFKTAEDALTAINGVYDAMQDLDFYNRHYQMICDLPGISSTNNRSGGWRGDIDKYLWDAENEGLALAWKALYDGVARANTVISRVGQMPDATIDPALRERIVLEARFLRGFYYFSLIRLWGNVPLIEKEIRSLQQDLRPTNVGTAPAVWELIINDLQAAESLPASYSGNDVGRATSGAAKAMLGTVYLQRSGLGVANEWQLALDKFTEVINSGRYKLLANYADLFEPENDNGPESIFNMQAGQGFGSEGQIHGAMTGIRGADLVPAGGWSSWTSEPEFFDLFSNNDLRKEAIFVTSFEKDGKVERYPGSSFMQNPHFKKYWDQGAVANSDYANDIYVIRFADVWLMHSEAMNEVNPGNPERLTGINQVRQRAGLPPLDHTLSQEDFRKALLLEREKELCMEQKSVFDYRRFGLELTRWIVGLSQQGYTVEGKHMLYPIPQQEIERYGEAGGLQQNAGY